MQKTIDLLRRALDTQPARFWANRYFIDESLLSIAKKRGRLSPAIAGNLAMDLGLDPIRWIAIAAMETERDNPTYQRLREVLNQTNP